MTVAVRVLQVPNIAPEGATVPQNPSPEGANPYSEGDNSCNPVWTWDKNNCLKSLNLNRELYAFTCGCRHGHPMAKKLYQKRNRLNYKRYRRRLKDESSMTLNYMHLADSIPTI